MIHVDKCFTVIQDVKQLKSPTSFIALEHRCLEKLFYNKEKNAIYKIRVQPSSAWNLNYEGVLTRYQLPVWLKEWEFGTKFKHFLIWWIILNTYYPEKVWIMADNPYLEATNSENHVKTYLFNSSRFHRILLKLVFILHSRARIQASY